MEANTTTTTKLVFKEESIIDKETKWFIYHQECVDGKPIPAELTEGKKASEGQ